MKRILATLLICVTLWASDQEILQVYQLFNVKTTTVQEESVELTQTLYGKAVVDERTVTAVSPRFDGYVEKLHADFTYQRITKGERLFDYYSPEVLAAQVELINALSYPNRGKLVDSAEEKLRLYNIPDATIKQIKKSRQKAANLAYHSPVNGIIMKKEILAGGAFKKGQTLYQITDLSHLWIEAEAYQEQKESLHPGMKARIHIKGIQEALTGTITQHNPQVDPATQTFTVRIDIANPNLNIYPGMFADVSVATRQQTSLTLPKTAVIEKGDRHIVFIAGEFEGEYEPTTIRAKRLSNGKYQIISGLESGTRVVDNALFLMDSDAQMNGMY